MRPLRQFACFVLLMCIAAANMSGQVRGDGIAEVASVIEAPDRTADENLFSFRREVSEVQVSFLAFPSPGSALRDLQPRDVQVVTDGDAKPQISSFRRLPSQPITLGILIDLSESVHPETHLQALAFSDAVTSLLHPAQDLEFSIGFSTSMSVLQSATSDFKRVKRSLEQLTTGHNLTSLYDAVIRTCEEQFSSQPGRVDDQRILLLFTDGVDNLSIHSLEDAMDAAISNRVIVYAIAPMYGDPEGKRALELLTSRTGGQLELLRRSESPRVSLASMQAYTEPRYELSFRPPDTRPGFHRLEVRPVAENSMTLRAPQAYYVRRQDR